MMHFPKCKEETVKIHPKPRLLSALVFFLNLSYPGCRNKSHPSKLYFILPILNPTREKRMKNSADITNKNAWPALRKFCQSLCLNKRNELGMEM